MIEKIYEKYDECTLFISSNEKRIAKENMHAIRISILFSIIGGLTYFFSSWSFKVTTRFEGIFLLFIAEMLVFYALYKRLYPKISESMKKVRVFAFFFYAVILITLTLIETLRTPNMRSYVFFAGIFIITTIYTDYFFISTVYKLGLSVIFIAMSLNMKPDKVVTLDVVAMIMTLLFSSHCYFVVMLNNSKRSEDSRSVEKKSVTDLLTGLSNKLSFEERSKEYLTDRVVGAKATLFIFDFDNFKRVNDTYGHQIGDEALKLFATILKDYFHSTDVIGRVGGDEFMALVMGATPEDFVNIRCRKIQHDLRIAKIGDASGFSCSIGICEDTKAHTFEELYKIADSALYEAKKNGKACHVVKFG
ncbi:MAG: diguanylate cyclase [Butyrivibrio sp.]|nr:diguanylate cyclase [Butyrivibrio sp.]